MPTLPVFPACVSSVGFTVVELPAILAQAAKARSSTFPVASTYPVVNDLTARVI